MSGSLTNLFTAAQNIASALNDQATNANALAGNRNFTDITNETVVSANAGRLVRVSVVAASSATGAIYDASSIATATTSRVLYTIPATVGVYEVNLPVAYGITVSPGASMTVSGSYS